MNIVALLRSKNRCLQQFREMSREFLERAEEGDLSGLDLLQSRREATLKAVDLYDRKLGEFLERMTTADKTPAIVDAVKLALLEKEDLVHQILEIDLRIVEHVEREKSRLLREMSQARKGKEVISKFKSTWIAQAGEELDKEL